MENLKQYIKHNLKKEGIEESHPMIWEHMLFYTIKYYKNNKLKTEDIETLEQMNLTIEDLEEIQAAWKE